MSMDYSQSFYHDFFVPMANIIGSWGDQAQAFAVLAIQQYALRAESAGYGVFLSENVVDSIRSQAIPGGAERMQQVFNDTPLGDEYAFLRKDTEFPYKDHSGYLSSSIELEGFWDEGSRRVSFEGNFGNFAAPVIKRGESGYKWGGGLPTENYFTFVDEYVQSHYGVSLVGYFQDEMKKAISIIGSVSDVYKEIKARYRSTIRRHRKGTTERMRRNSQKFKRKVMTSKSIHNATLDRYGY